MRVLTRLPASAPAWLERLSAWLEPFEVCFTHVAQRGAFRRYLLGLLSDSRRKSMSAMLERVHDAGTYQAFQHFITDAPWSADAVWRHLRATLPDSKWPPGSGPRFTDLIMERGRHWSPERFPARRYPPGHTCRALDHSRLFGEWRTSCNRASGGVP